MAFIRLLCFLVAVFVSTELRGKTTVSALQCHCLESDALARGCTLINGSRTMPCKDGEVCMELMGQNYNLPIGCWYKPVNSPGNGCRYTKAVSTYDGAELGPVLVCHCDTDWCRVPANQTLVGNGAELLNSCSAVGLISIGVIICFLVARNQ